ncbi:MAG: hypothetical protein HXY40_17805 [Chloroflexi bacterium]|nr:hypothetical protein [Chloroflexota bacterium]
MNTLLDGRIVAVTSSSPKHNWIANLIAACIMWQDDAVYRLTFNTLREDGLVPMP